MNAECESWLSGRIAEAVHWPRRLRPGEWCEKNLIISRRQMTPFPGPYRMRPNSPWAEGWFEALADESVETFALKKGAQVSATTTAYCQVCDWMVNDPDPITMVGPTEAMMKSASRLRIQPMMEDSPAVRDTFTDNADDMTLLELKTRLTSVRLVGSNSAAALTMFPSRFIVVDEVDKFKEQLGREGASLGLIFSRSKQYTNRKHFVMGTPTTKAGQIERLYQLGDKRKFFVPCPVCGAFQFLRWAQVKFDSKLPPEEVGASAFYECAHCGAELDDGDKADMVQLGVWRATAKPKREGYASAWLSGLYSLSDECSFGALAEKFLSVKDNAIELQQFLNEDLGELWEERPVVPFAQAQVYAIKDRMEYARGSIPTSDDVYVVLVADVMGLYLIWTVWAMGPKDMWLVDNGSASVLEDLDSIAAGPYVDADGREYAVHMMILDSGHRTTEVYKFHLRRSRRTILIKGGTGSTTTQTMPIRFQELDRMPNGDKLAAGHGIKLRHVHPTFFKDELVVLLQPLGDDEEISTLPLRLWFHADIGKDFADQITGEIPVEETKADKFGNKKKYWKEIRANHYFDCAQYALATRWMLRNDLNKLAVRAQRKERARREEEAKKKGGDAGKDTKNVKRKKKVLAPFVDPGSVRL